ncbi:MAG: riboflavin synthase [Verrucomicrobiaceae bacterium]
MFTGIVETTARVHSLHSQENGGRLVLEGVPFAVDLTLGESVAVNGCCLTVVEFGGETCSFDLLAETLRLTNLGTLAPGSMVNLERAMRADTRFSGHFVQGHVDTTAEVLVYQSSGQDHQFTIESPAAFSTLVAHKGSICIDGMSLTIAELTAETITIWITPHTHAVTTLRSMSAGWRVNLEFDMLAKYLDRMLAARLAQ